MSNKILTVSVAAYNSEAYLSRALESCLIPAIENLEIIVVDDGSTDRTADIAKEFVLAFPGSFRLVSKENGGYGSTVNASLKLARGKYFRLLDSDDWFDSESLTRLVETLDAIECDMVVSPYFETTASRARVIDNAAQNVRGTCSLSGEVIPGVLSMHSTVFKTDLLKRLPLELPERIQYTDSCFVAMPLKLVNSVYVSHEPVYCYLVERAGQSMSISSMMSHYHDMELVLEKLIAEFAMLPDSAAAKCIVGAWVAGVAGNLIQALNRLPASEGPARRVRRLIDEISAVVGLHEVCSDNSRAFAFLSGVPKVLYPLASLSLRLYGRLKG